jgi:8-oxo-dGTP pyrophosphatase MutT (NUDIX family)
VTDLTPGFTRHLEEWLRGRSALAANDAGAQRAAVAVVVAGFEPALLFVRRVERSGDPWSGHIAFPGGFVSRGDVTAEDTACRETEEETGLPLARLGRLLGRLDDVAPRTPYLPPIVVTPVVFTLPRTEPVAASDEVAAALWVPVAALIDPANRRPFEVHHSAGRRTFDSIQTHGLTIWGLTERIITQLTAES